jgi:hypothetical protein
MERAGSDPLFSDGIFLPFMYEGLWKWRFQEITSWKLFYGWACSWGLLRVADKFSCNMPFMKLLINDEKIEWAHVWLQRKCIN